MIEVKVPSVGESVSSGQIAMWHVADGDHVKAGDPLLVLETDKVSIEIEAPLSPAKKSAKPAVPIWFSVDKTFFIDRLSPSPTAVSASRSQSRSG